MKTCSQCGVLKEDSHFVERSDRPGKRHSWCKVCRASKENSRRRAVGVSVRNLSAVTDTTKTCCRCRQEKPRSDFYPASRGRGGLSAKCKECVRLSTDKSKSRAATAAYRKDNPQWKALHRIHQFNRRSSVKATSDGSATADFMRSVYETEKCAYCSGFIEPKLRTADHKIPLKRGGWHSSENIVMACHACNSAKGQLTDEEFKERNSDND